MIGQWILTPEIAAPVSAWIGTYAIHSSVLFVIALLCARFWRSPRVREQLWRAALFGPLVTASLQLGAGLDPLSGTWSIKSENQSEETWTASAEEIPSELALAMLASLEPETQAQMTVSEAELPATATARSVWSIIASMLMALGIAALTLRALLETARVQRLGQRTRIREGRIVEMVEELRRAAGIARRVRVERTERGSVSPYATGVLFPRIVVPARAFEQLDARAQRAMLAHELGHVARFDPLWTAAARSMCALFFFQPLNWVSARKLEENAEFACDEFAVHTTGDEVALAHCLTVVAEWIIGSPSASAACPMAHKRSKLSERVERILATDQAAPRRSVGTRAIGALAVSLTALSAPGIAIAADAETSVRFIRFDAEAEIDALRIVDLYENLEMLAEVVELEIEEIRALGGQYKIDASTLAKLDSIAREAAHMRELIALFKFKASAR